MIEETEENIKSTNFQAIESEKEEGISEHDESEANDSGFGSHFTNSEIRLMNVDGTLNVRKKGINHLRQFNIHKQLVKLSSLQFYLALCAAYFIINACFATIYFSLGIDHFSISGDSFTWADAFFFSNQTFTTVGYGHISPNSFSANLLSSTEAFVGLLYFAIATGLVYGRFSNSKADIRFSKNLLFSRIGDQDVIMVRIANISSDELSEIDAEIIMSYIEDVPVRGPIRRYKNLKLDIDHINLLTTSWTLVHRISEDSPSAFLNEKKNFVGLEFMVFISAFDEIFDQKVKTRTSYMEQDLVHNAKFVPITQYDNEKAIVDLDKLSAYRSL